MAKDRRVSPKLSERFSDLFGVDALDILTTAEATPAVYLEESRKLSLNKLLHLAPYSDVLLLLGDAGVGRSTLLKAFVKRTAGNWRISFISATALMDGATILRQIARGFNLDLDDTEALDDLLWAVNRFLQSLSRSGRRAIIIIDDAHLLTDDVLLLMEKILRNENDDNSVSLILSMRTEQGSRLDRFALLSERLAYTLSLEPLTRKEVAGYLRHRLAGQTDELEEILTPQVIDDITQKSHGLPEQINIQAHSLIMGRKRGKRGATGGRNWSRLMVLAGIVAIAAGALLFYQDEVNKLFKLNGATEPVDEVSIKQSQPANETTEPPATAMATMGDEELAMIGVQESLPIPVPIEQPVTEATVPPSSDTPAETSPPTTAVDQAGVSSDSAPPEPVIAAVAEKAEPVPAPAPPAPKPKPVPKLSPQMQWLKAQPDTHYTMQLMALEDEALVNKLMHDWKISDQAATYPITRRGKKLTVMIYGSYPSQAAAVKAAANLPRSWRVKDPWVRSFANVRKDIGAN